jgi:hypothetical protein
MELIAHGPPTFLWPAPRHDAAPPPDRKSADRSAVCLRAEKDGFGASYYSRTFRLERRPASSQTRKEDMLTDVIQVALIVVAGAIVAAIIVIVAIRSFLPAKGADGDAAEGLRQREAELEALRVAKAESDRRLAVAEEKASRIPGLDATLRETRELVERLREEKTAAERAFGAARETLAAKCEAALADIRMGKGKVEEALAAKSEAVERLEAADRELRDRLAAGERGRADLVARYDTLRGGRVEHWRGGRRRGE